MWAHFQNIPSFKSPNSRYGRLLNGICVLVLAGILTAGLWPFQAPKNQARWTSSGLWLGRHGTAFSWGNFPDPVPESKGRSIEIWIQPADPERSGTILAFYRPGHHQQFSLHQSKGFLALQAGQDNLDATSDPAKIAYVFADFGQLARRCVSIAVGPQGTAAYVDGVLVRELSLFRPAVDSFTGRLVVGTSPVTNDIWSGLLSGLALYDRELTVAEVRRDCESFITRGTLASDRAVAAYLFDERAGSVIHEAAAVHPDLDLFIPERFTILHKKFLDPVWDEFEWTQSYAKSSLLNVVGFVPLGYFFCALLRFRRTHAPLLATILLGASISLLIEVLQGFLPTRSSGTTDLITNTLGTWLGAALYLWNPSLLAWPLRLVLTHHGPPHWPVAFRRATNKDASFRYPRAPACGNATHSAPVRRRTE